MSRRTVRQAPSWSICKTWGVDKSYGIRKPTRKKKRSNPSTARKRLVVIDVTSEDEDVDTGQVYGRLILPGVSEINTEPLLGKITVSESRLESLRQNLIFTRNYHDYYQQQRDGDCGLVSVNNLVGFCALTEDYMNEVQDRLREKQPDRQHIYVCSFFMYF
jgi:hypothetical protein